MNKTKLASQIAPRLLVLVITHLGIWGCGSSSSVRAALEVAGTISGVTTATSSLSTLGAKTKTALTEAPLKGEKITLYNDSGEVVGEGETDETGTYSIEVRRGLLTPHDEESVTEQLILVSSSGYVSFVRVTVDTSTETITIDADSDSTLAAEAMRDRLEDLGCEDFEGCDFEAVGVDFDPHCFFQLEKKKWELAAAGGSGVAGPLRTMKEMIQTQMAAGELGSYSSPREMIQGFLDGTVPVDFQSQAATNAANVAGGEAATYASSAEAAISGIDQMMGVLKRQFSGSAGTGVTALSRKGVVEPASDSLCAAIFSNPSVLEQTIKLLMASESFSEVANVFGSADAIGTMLDFWKVFKGSDGAYDFSKMDPQMGIGLMAGCVGNFANCRPSTLKLLLESAPPSSAAVNARDYGKMASAACLVNAGGCDPAKVAGWAAGQVAGGVDPDKIDPSAIGIAYESATASEGADFTACRTNPNSCSNLARACSTNADCLQGNCDTVKKLCLASTTSSTTTTTSGTTSGGTTTTQPTPTPTQQAVTYCGTYTKTRGQGCPQQLTETVMFTGSGNGPCSVGSGNETHTFTVSGGCSGTLGGMACSQCSYVGNGEGGTRFDMQCVGCAITMTKQ